MGKLVHAPQVAVDDGWRLRVQKRQPRQDAAPPAVDGLLYIQIRVLLSIIFQRACRISHPARPSESTAVSVEARVLQKPCRTNPRRHHMACTRLADPRSLSPEHRCVR
jgi:hypothetical protein